MLKFLGQNIKILPALTRRIPNLCSRYKNTLHNLNSNYYRRFLATRDKWEIVTPVYHSVVIPSTNPVHRNVQFSLKCHYRREAHTSTIRKFWASRYPRTRVHKPRNSRGVNSPQQAHGRDSKLFLVSVGTNSSHLPAIFLCDFFTKRRISSSQD